MEKKKILLIEDDDFLRELYIDVLTSEGFLVEAAEDGLKGLEKFRKGGWDLALVDIVLPGMNGMDVVKTILKESPTKLAKHIVFSSNLYNDQQEQNALKYGEGYLVKVQLTPDKFIEEVKKHLD